METDASTPAQSNRPRPLLLILLGVLVVAFVWMKLAGSAGPAAPSSNSVAPRTQQSAAGRGQRPASQDGQIDASSLDVQLETLAEERPGPADTERNPFRFRP